MLHSKNVLFEAAKVSFRFHSEANGPSHRSQFKLQPFIQCYTSRCFDFYLEFHFKTLELSLWTRKSFRVPHGISCLHLFARKTRRNLSFNSFIKLSFEEENTARANRLTGRGGRKSERRAVIAACISRHGNNFHFHLFA
jgi:hypothetical protein